MGARYNENSQPHSLGLLVFQCMIKITLPNQNFRVIRSLKPIHKDLLDYRELSEHLSKDSSYGQLIQPQNAQCHLHLTLHKQVKV